MRLEYQNNPSDILPSVTPFSKKGSQAGYQSVRGRIPDGAPSGAFAFVAKPATACQLSTGETGTNQRQLAPGKIPGNICERCLPAAMPSRQSEMVLYAKLFMAGRGSARFASTTQTDPLRRESQHLGRANNKSGLLPASGSVPVNITLAR